VVRIVVCLRVFVVVVVLIWIDAWIFLSGFYAFRGRRFMSAGVSVCRPPWAAVPPSCIDFII
jgi:hypothetical protein